MSEQETAAMEWQASEERSIFQKGDPTEATEALAEVFF